MKKNITHLLKNSLNDERQNIQTKDLNNINNKFKNAEVFFDQGSNMPQAVKVIRDTFTFSLGDHQLIELCKNKLIKNQITATKSEVIRAALKVLNELKEEELIKAFNNVEKIKTGRPKPDMS